LHEASRKTSEKPRRSLTGQLFEAPPAAHALSWDAAPAFDDGPPGGMFPPSQLRQDDDASATPGICPRPFSQVNAFDAVLVWLWQSGHRPTVPLFR
jgi:hypothetical protein